MQKINTVLKLVEHMNWADSKLWQSVYYTESAKIDERIRELMYHIHIVQHVYYLNLSGKAVTVPEVIEFRSLQNIAEWGFKTNQKILSLVSLMDEVELGMNMKNLWFERIEKELGKPPADTTAEESIIQVVSHSTYHRAQVNTRLHELTGAPAKIDFITWIWLGKPKSEWDNILHNL